MYLFDTDVLSTAVKPRPPLWLAARILRTSSARHFTSAITVGELLFGAYRLPSGGEALRARLHTVLLAHLEVLPYDRIAAEEYGRIRANLERRGQPLDKADLYIAAIAQARSLIVVTGNVRHFARVPSLRVENWLEEPP